jgi:cytochrome P450
VALFSLQSNEKHFDRAKEFLWKRWLGADPIKTKVDQGFVNPVFAAGGRNCIGQHMSLMETKIILSQLLNEYQFTVDKDLTIKWQLKLLYSFTPDNAIKCTRIKK